MVEALEGSEPRVFWLDSPDAPEPLPSLEGERRCRLAVVGGGITGRWAALLAAERGQRRLSRGVAHPRARERAVALAGRDRPAHRGGHARARGRLARGGGGSGAGPTASTCSCSTARRCEPRSTRPPTWPVSGSAGASATVDPARLAWGLRRAALEDGARIFERSLVRRLGRDGGGVRLETERGRLRTERVVLATNAYPPLLRSIRCYVIPVYDYCLSRSR